MGTELNRLHRSGALYDYTPRYKCARGGYSAGFVHGAYGVWLPPYNVVPALLLLTLRSYRLMAHTRSVIHHEYYFSSYFAIPRMETSHPLVFSAPFHFLYGLW